MTDNHDALAIEGVRFFGEMCASVSHEIKNVFAIINENAGLLQDMINMHEKGMSIAPERLSRLARSIGRQVNRGDGIVKHMNRFAHSADDAREPVDVGDLIQFVTELAGRLISMKGQPPHIRIPDTPVTVVTNRFFLENLVWCCLSRTMDAAPADKPIDIRVEESGDRVSIRIGGMGSSDRVPITGFPAPGEAATARLLGADLTIDKETNQICIIFIQRPVARA